MTDTITLPSSVVAGALHALDLSQALLESSKSIHHNTILEEYKALRAALAQQAEQGWQPIEIAPKSNPMKPEHRLIFWIDGVGPAFGYAYDDGTGGLLTVIDGYYGGRWEPTHWKPMLAAPKGGAS